MEQKGEKAKEFDREASDFLLRVGEGVQVIDFKHLRLHESLQGNLRIEMDSWVYQHDVMSSNLSIFD